MGLGKIEYMIIDDEEFDAEARLNGMRIGYANCVRTGDRLMLADIKIFDEPPQGRPTLIRRLQSFFGAGRPIQLRRRGIGSELLALVLREADSAGIRETWGSVTHEDLNNQPALLAWYQRHGFLIAEPDGECVNGAVKKVVRRR
jgi:hypothetical protein